jgi:pilus assembly protein CpaC
VGRLGIRKSLLVTAASLSLAVAAGGIAAAQQQSAGISANAGLEGSTEVGLSLNKSRIITPARPFNTLSVGNPTVADVVALSRTQFYVLGKTVGSTNVIVTDQAGSVIQVFDVNVGQDVDGLKRKIYEIAPNDNIEVRAAADAIVLSGTVADASRATAIAQIADRYAPGKVTNMIGVSGSQQVMLEVRFAEVQRSVLKDIGTNFKIQDIGSSGGASGNPFIAPGPNQIGLPGFNDAFDGALPRPGLVGGGSIDGVNPLAYAAIAGTWLTGDFSITAMFDFLEEKGLIRTLAEPNLVALSGDTAKFLAGGEFPIPMAQTQTSSVLGSTITVEFKEFGVSLAFTPTVTSKDAINLELNAEVSSLDPAASITIGSLSIPGLKVRRTHTTVELRDGQSFAISGLIQDDLTSTFRGIPGLASMPIIGALARSEGFERKQTELVVLITTRLVQPVSRDKLASPTDYGLAPSESDFFLFGKPEGVKPTGRTGGIDGPYGYVQP